MDTFLAILASLGSLYAVGLPVSSTVFSEEESDIVWAVAPFLGMALTILILQNFIYLGVPLQHSTPFFWGGVVALWASCFLRTWQASRLLPFPTSLVLFAGVIYSVHGLGLAIAGARYYVGRAWHDQFNYTSMAQFLMEQPFSLTFAQMGERPYLAKGIMLKSDRIGQSVYHGFASVSASLDAKTLFEPVILLGPLLVFMAVYLAARGLHISPRLSLWAALSGALLPAVAVIHLESFLSQALAAPFLLAWPFFVSRLMARFDARRLFAAAVVLAAGTSIYAEFFILFLGVAVFACAAQGRRGTWSGALAALAVFPAGLLLNPGFLAGLIQISGRVSVSNVLSGIYPWALGTEGFSRLLIGDWASFLQGTVGSLVGIASVAIAVTGLVGLGMAAWTDRGGLSGGLFCLGLLPLSLLVRGSHLPYQYYKILLSVAPLVPLGVMALVEAGRRAEKEWVALRRALRGALLVLLVAVPCAATAHLSVRSGLGTTQREIGRGGAHKLLLPSTRWVQGALSSLQGANLLIDWHDDFFAGNFVNAWLSYFARHSRVWLGNPQLGDANLSGLPVTDFDPSRVEASFLLLKPSDNSAVTGTSARLAWLKGPYALWRLSGWDWIWLSDVVNPNGTEKTSEGQTFFWIGGGKTVIHLWAGRGGTAVLRAVVFPGPSLPEISARRFLIRTGDGHESAGTFDGLSILSLPVPVRAGRGSISLEALDKPTVVRMPNGDMRPLVFQLRDLEIEAFLHSPVGR